MHVIIIYSCSERLSRDPSPAGRGVPKGESLPRSLNKTTGDNKGSVAAPEAGGARRDTQIPPERVCSTSRNKTLVVAALTEPAATPEGGIREVGVSSGP